VNVDPSILDIAPSVQDAAVEHIESIDHQVDFTGISDSQDFLHSQVQIPEGRQPVFANCTHPHIFLPVCGIGTRIVLNIDVFVDGMSLTSVESHGDVEIIGKLVESLRFEHPVGKCPHTCFSACGTQLVSKELTICGPLVGGIEWILSTPVISLILPGERTHRHPLIGQPLVGTEIETDINVIVIVRIVR